MKPKLLETSLISAKTRGLRITRSSRALTFLAFAFTEGVVHALDWDTSTEPGIQPGTGGNWNLIDTNWSTDGTTLVPWNTLTLAGPFGHQLDNKSNPFTDCNLTVKFTHESGSPSY